MRPRKGKAASGEKGMGRSSGQKPRRSSSHLMAAELKHHFTKESQDGLAKRQDTAGDGQGDQGQQEAILHGGSAGLISGKI